MGTTKQTPLTGDHCRLVEGLFVLPHKILQHYHLQGLSQMILHEIGHDTSFNFNRAVYLIDNPDFDHLVGAAGFCSNDCQHHQKNLWEKPECFCNDMKPAQYHNDVKKFFRESLKRKDINLHSAHDLEELASVLSIENPQSFSWNMKHGNHGILLFDTKNELDALQKNLLSYSAALLSLCGI